jgi:hypothetical protein
MPDKEITKRKKMIYAITWYHFKFFHYVTHCTRQVQRIIYLAIVHLVPLPLRILHITYIMTRDGCIHDIMMDNHSIQAVHRAIIICFAHELGQIQVLWELDILADLTKNTRLSKEKGFELNVNTMLLYKFVPNPTQENINLDIQKRIS